jgi:hypothetical protein
MAAPRGAERANSGPLDPASRGRGGGVDELCAPTEDDAVWLRIATALKLQPWFLERIPCRYIA